jgi:hypothetical protein
MTIALDTRPTVRLSLDGDSDLIRALLRELPDMLLDVAEVLEIAPDGSSTLRLRHAWVDAET